MTACRFAGALCVKLGISLGSGDIHLRRDQGRFAPSQPHDSTTTDELAYLDG